MLLKVVVVGPKAIIVYGLLLNKGIREYFISIEAI